MSYGTDGLLLNMSASGGRGKADGADTFYTNTGINAGQQVSITSGGDTTLKGAVVAANTVIADVSGNLNIQSLQDTSTYASSQQSLGGSLSVGYGKMSGSISASQSNIDSNFASVGQQSGIKAGDGGFQVSVAGNTTLNASVIASTDKAVDDGKNTFATGGTLSISDIQNSASYSANSTSISVAGGPQQEKLSLNGLGIGIGSDKGEASSTSSAGISGIAGNTAVRTGDAETGLAKIFDAEKVQKEINAQTQITQYFTQQGAKAVGDYAQTKLNEAKLLEAQANATTDAAKRDELMAQVNELRGNWGDKGVLRLALHALIGGLTGGVNGALGAAAGTLTAPTVAKALLDAGIDGPLASTLTEIASTAAGAAVGGTAGGVAAANEVVNNYVSHSPFAKVRVTVAQENARLVNECGANCTLTDLRNIDLLMGKLDTVGTLSEIAKNSQLTTDQAISFGENLAALLPVYGTPIALYQAITGQSITGTSLSDTERFFNGVAAAIPAGTIAYKVINDAVTDSRWAVQQMVVLREASMAKNASRGNFGLGEATAAQAKILGEAWTGPGYKVASDGKTLVSADGLRQYRPPTDKPNSSWATTGSQANFQGRVSTNPPDWTSNGHLNIR